MEEYKRNYCFLKTKQPLNMYKIKLQKTSKCLWPLDIDMLVVKWMFFSTFSCITFRSVLHKIAIDFWDVYDVNLCEKLAITVKFCCIETRLKEGYDLRGYFLKITKEMEQSWLFITFLNEHLLEAVFM